MRFVFPLLGLLLVLTASALGQQATRATLTGVVTDPNGAVVPGVTITATQTANGVSRQTTSNDEGLYVLTDLAPGDYEIRVEAKGFSTKVSKVPVPVKVGQSITLNVPLEVGTPELTVVDLVDPGKQAIDTSSSHCLFPATLRRQISIRQKPTRS